MATGGSGIVIQAKGRGGANRRKQKETEGNEGNKDSVTPVLGIKAKFGSRGRLTLPKFGRPYLGIRASGPIGD
jgi:hypothetical protein